MKESFETRTHKKKPKKKDHDGLDHRRYANHLKQIEEGAVI